MRNETIARIIKGFNQNRVNSVISWTQKYISDEKLLKKIWSPKYSKKYPLIIPMNMIKKIIFPWEFQESDFFKTNQFNPVVINRGEFFDIAWRIGNSYSYPKVDFSGRQILISTGKLDYVALATLSYDEINGFSDLREPNLLKFSDLRIVGNFEESSKLQLQNLVLEDPRFIPGKPHLILVHVRSSENSTEVNLVTPTVRVAVVDRQNRTIRILTKPNLGKSEKNWVPIDSNNEEIRLLKSTIPLSVVTLNIRTNEISEQVLVPGVFGKVHNGTNLLMIDNKFYIRVVREVLNLRGLRGVRFSSIAVHDLQLQELYRTKPFIFRRFGFEICNSICEYQGKIFFAWGENDEFGFLGIMDKEKLLTWISAVKKE